MSLFTGNLLQQVREGNLEALERFDQHGLILGPEESPAQLADRVANLRDNFAEMRQELGRDGKLEFLGTQLRQDDAIPNAVFEAARTRTSELYGFEIDWVPGFFSNYKMGFLHAGCAFYSYEDFFALFVLRKSFQKREKWLIYSRTELMTHELCHIAHVSFRSLNYEEIFAYQTATSAFRRIAGGVLRTTTDTVIILGALAALMVAQILNVSLRPPELWNSFPMPLVFALAFGAIGLVILRYMWYHRRWRRALARLTEALDARRARAVLFRCSDEEIASLAALEKSAVSPWLAERRQQELRWQVIGRRFLD